MVMRMPAVHASLLMPRVLHSQVIALTFLLSIGLMIATFWVAWKLGAIRLNE
jgi:hypothetical protein